MEGQFQTSFIPKRPLAQNSPGTPRRAPNLFLVIASVILVTTIIISVAEFGYNIYLSNHTASVKDQLNTAVTQLQPNLVDSVSRLDSRIQSTKTILSQHVALSSFFDFLSRSTLNDVRFISFNYSITPDQKISISMGGTAKSFAAMVFQVAQFSLPESVKFIQNPAFTSLGLDKTGFVDFNFSATLDPKIYSYSKKLAGTTFSSGSSTSPTNTPSQHVNQ